MAGNSPVVPPGEGEALNSLRTLADTPPPPVVPLGPAPLPPPGMKPPNPKDACPLVVEDVAGDVAAATAVV